MMSPTQARFASALVIALSLGGLAQSAHAQEAKGPTIFDVRRSLPLEPDEEVTKDFYINAGPESGMKKGVYISVIRAVPVHNPIRNQQQATLNIPVGKLRVIDVQAGITVARLESELSDDDRPTLEFEGVMVGDHVDLGTITSEQPKKPKAKAKRKMASTEQGSATSASLATSAGNEELNPGSAEAMAARSAASVAETLQATQPAPSTAGAAVEMTTTAEVKNEPKTEASPNPPSSATTNSNSLQGQPETAPKKSQAPKSAHFDLEHPERKSFPQRSQTDTVRVADYSDLGY